MRIKQLLALCILLCLSLTCATVGSATVNGLQTPAPTRKPSANSSSGTATGKVAQYPYRSVAYITAHMACGCDRTGTGFLISRCGLLTAATCLICQDHGKKVEDIDFYFGRTSDGRYVKRYEGRYTYYAGANFKSGSYSKYENKDYAYVLFDDPIGDELGWFGLKSLSKSELEARLPEFVYYENGSLKTTDGFLVVRNSSTAKHWMYAPGGSAGGPMFVREGGDYYVIAFNISWHDDYNVAYRISDTLLKKLRKDGVL